MTLTTPPHCTASLPPPPFLQVVSQWVDDGKEIAGISIVQEKCYRSGRTGRSRPFVQVPVELAEAVRSFIRLRDLVVVALAGRPEQQISLE